jgi:hypothetical protein
VYKTLGVYQIKGLTVNAKNEYINGIWMWEICKSGLKRGKECLDYSNGELLYLIENKIPHLFYTPF